MDLPDESLTGRIFGVQQRIDAERQRRSVGGELGLDHARGFGLVTLDYDVDFRDVGAISLLATTRLGEQTAVNARVDARRYRSTPTGYSALQGRSVTTVQQLHERLSQSEIRAPAFDAGAETRTVKLEASRQLAADLLLSADVSLESVIPDPLSPARKPATAREQIDYSLRATWKDLLISQSSTTAALRIAECRARGATPGHSADRTRCC